MTSTAAAFQKMSARLSRSRRATPEYLLEFLSEQNVKHVCELLSIDAAGRRKTLVTRLLVAAGRPTVSEQMSTAEPKPAAKASLDRADLSQVAAKTSRGGSGKRPMKKILYTIGCNGIPEPAEMAVTLREHGVEVLVDVRVRPYGRKVLFNKKRLEDVQGPMKLAGLDYLHIVELGNAGKDEGLIRLKDEVKGLERLSGEVTRRVVAIMCQCKEPEECHRSDVAKKMGKRMPGLRIEHLRAPSQT